MIELLVKALLAYLLGSVMGGLVLGRLTGTGDLRQSGSGNAGATNALRTRGKRFGLAVLAIDALKGVLAVLLLPRLPWPMVESLAVPDQWIALACGVAVTLGHIAPVFFGFVGGKGAATLLGVCIVTVPAAVPWALLGFVITLVLSGYAGLSTLMAALVMLLHVACWSAAGLWSPLGAFASAMFLLVVWTHRENLLRMARGEEARFERAMLWRRWRGSRP
ncbi:glycerol-3-phosphate 1-O-acyltransferase PlsY [Abyssibacter profundi]|uniref:Glycerol-3-phosphate acyltransferase n=1 Tax=Abyssibacter profundi TaxID=2182787 RepID=A0A363UQD0_9GAMM|nr:glycerol-3-phosphate 1-O-acyltransferase PlsY [Abyssibacter profundi]MBV59908.1 acyl-phosphate glycerol 3-phosphate acyltransferase [Nevskiales bacterium]PWN57717.1 acyl-phosphate glycerol 3-phosphate acyltransferase [Abyssibacter profundi]